MPVFDSSGRGGIGDPNRYDVACLQLQLLECLELVKRKDDKSQHYEQEVDMLYRRVRDYLLVQDQLYKDFVAAEKDFDG